MTAHPEIRATQCRPSVNGKYIVHTWLPNQDTCDCGAMHCDVPEPQPELTVAADESKQQFLDLGGGDEKR